MVADGMGAHAVGELASKMACENIPHNYAKAKNLTAIEAMIKAYREVGGQIHTKATANRDFQGMGTTCSTLLLLPDGAVIAHVGDSRIYRVRGDRIDQLTFDHSLVWELKRRNHLPSDEAARGVPRNVITRSLGPDPTVEVDIEGPLQVEHGDVFLLCSDGLSGPVTDPEIGAFAGHFHPEDACRYLLNLANLRGGLDNITIVTLRMGPWVEPGTAAGDPAGGPGEQGPRRRTRLQARQSDPDPDPTRRQGPCGEGPVCLGGLPDRAKLAQASGRGHPQGTGRGDRAVVERGLARPVEPPARGRGSAGRRATSAPACAVWAKPSSCWARRAACTARNMGRTPSMADPEGQDEGLRRGDRDALFDAGT